MKISVICSDTAHPIYPLLQEWCHDQSLQHSIELVSTGKNVTGGDILFLISCHEIIGKNIRERYKKTLVIHANDLPKDRGWSPHIWQIVEGSSDLVVTLLEADEQVDSGAIWKKLPLHIEDNEVADEINSKLFRLEIELMSYAIEEFGSIRPQLQPDHGATYYPKRKPNDSRIDPYGTIADQFDLMRVADPNRFPAFIDYRGFRFNIKLEKIGRSPDSENS